MQFHVKPYKNNRYNLTFQHYYRIIAAANGIDFESEECPSVGPCAGTCAQCDSEAEYFRREMSKIPEEKRVYPQFDVKENKQ